MRALRLRSLLGIFLGIAMMTIMMSAAPPPAYCADRTWSDGTGDWSTAANWGGTEPVSGDNAIINNGGTANVTLTGEVCSYLYLGQNTGTSGNVNISTGALSTGGNTEYVGYRGTGAFTQSGGTNTTFLMYLGYYSGASGTYTQSGGYNSAQYTYLGYNTGSYGTYTQTGGTANMLAITLGVNTGSRGTYDLSGTGVLNASNQESIGYNGTGTFKQTGGTNQGSAIYVGYEAGGRGTYTQSGGTVKVTSGLVVGINFGSYGTYELSGTGVVDVSSSGATETIGTNGTGIFTQSGGTNLAATFYIGGNAGSVGTYNLQGGVLSVGTFGTGAGTSTFNIDGGTFISAGNAIKVTNFNVGYSTGSSGSYTLASGNSLTATNEYIGRYGTGTLTQSGGTNAVTALTLGSGTYNLSDGILSATTITKNAGSFNFTGGTLTVATFNGALSVPSAGYLSPGSPLGLTTVNGDFTDSGTILFHMAGITTRGATYDAVTISNGDVTLNSGSKLQLAGLSGYAPLAGDSFNLISWTSGKTYSAPDGFSIDNQVGMGTFSSSVVGQSLMLTFALEEGGHTWNASSPSSWATSSDWSPGTVPDVTTEVMVNNTATLDVATDASAKAMVIGNGTININSGGTLTTSSIFNSDGTGNLNIEGGALALSGNILSVDNFSVGNATGATGSFTLDGDKTAYITNEYVGNNGTGVLTHSGGTARLAANLYVGYNAGSSGTYALSSTGILDASSANAYEYIGYSGLGVFSQSGGTNQVYKLYIGQNSGGVGTYTQSGGTTKVTNYLYLGYNTGSSGTYSLSGAGVLDATGNAYEYLGYYGTGAFTQSGGTNQMSLLYIGGASGGCGTYTQSGGTTKGGVIYVGQAAGSSGTYSISGTGVLSGYVYSGYYGTGMFTQTGGTVQVSTMIVGYYSGSRGTYNQSGGTMTMTASLYLGYNAGSYGTYSLSGTGVLDVSYTNHPYEYIGYSGTGNFIQTGGTNYQVYYLYVGYSSGSRGTYTQSGGTTRLLNYVYLGYNAGSYGTYELSGTGCLDALSNNAYEEIGYSGSGAFTQTGGTNKASNVYIGYNAGSLGTYALSGTGVLDAIGYPEYIGYSGRGTFTQSGGTNKPGSVYLGYNAGSLGTYALSGTGVLSGATEYVGNYGTGAFTQTGGTNQAATLYVGYYNGSKGTYEHSAGTTKVTNALYAGYNAGSIGTYSLSGTGVLDATGTTEYIGYFGSGAFTQTGGTNTVTTLQIANQAGSRGIYNLQGGKLTASTITLGTAGTSAFSFTGGTLSVGTFNGALTVGAAGTLSPGTSPGLTTVNGNLDNYGTLYFELGGTGTRGSAYDAIDVYGGVKLENGSVLRLAPWLGFRPASGNYFDVIYSSGGFSLYNYSIVSDIPGASFGAAVVGNYLRLTASYPPLEWDNPTSGDWATPVNWDPNVTPGTASDASINNGGTANVAVAAAANVVTIGNGTISLNSGGTLTAISIANGTGSGTLNLNGGALNLTTTSVVLETVNIGNDAPTTFELPSGWTIGATNESVGNSQSSASALNQQGGVNTATTLAIGEAEYNLNGGTLSAGTIANGTGTGTLSLNGGVLNLTGSSIDVDNMNIGNIATGTFALAPAKALAAGALTIGNEATGTFTQTGGTVSVVSAITIGAQSGASGTYTYTGGTLTDGANNANMIVRNNATATGTFQGSGAVDLSGTLTNNGKVIADGGTLDMSSFTSVTSTIENPTTGGTNGWFVDNAGKLVLPSIPVSTGSPTVIWGESQSEAGPGEYIDLVNSLKLVFTDVTHEGNLKISLLDFENPDAPPKGAGVGLGYFSMEALDGLAFSSVAVTLRYDDLMIADLGIPLSKLKFYHYYSNLWHPVGSTLDEDNNLLTLSGIPHFDGIGAFGDPPGPLDNPVPEPVTVLSFIAGIFMLALRKVFKRKA